MPGEKIILKPKPPKGEDGYRYLSIRIKCDMIAQLDDLSAKTGISRNELIRVFLDYGLTHYQIVDSTDTEYIKLR